MLDQALASLRGLYPGDAQRLAVKSSGAHSGQLIDFLQLLVGDGLLGECVHGAGFIEQSVELFVVQASHGEAPPIVTFRNFTDKTLPC